MWPSTPSRSRPPPGASSFVSSFCPAGRGRLLLILLIALNVCLMFALMTVRSPPVNSDSHSTLSQLQQKHRCADCRSAAPQECSQHINEALRVVDEWKTTLMSGGAVTSTSTSSTHTRPYLIIGIPTESRDVNHLEETLQTIVTQMETDPTSPMYSAYMIYVMNNNAPDKSHPAFDSARQKYGDINNIVFVTNPQTHKDQTPNERDDGTPTVPGWKQRKHTRDVVATMDVARDKSHYYLMLEDDFAICPHTLNILHHITTKAFRTHSNWFSVKMSYGMNGLLLKNGPDLREFGEYLISRQRARPLDHLMVEWATGESERSRSYKGDRPHLTYRYNLMDPLISRSSRSEKSGTRCFHEMNTEVVFEVEAFRSSSCAHDDMSPCLSASNPARVSPYPIDPAWHPT